MAFVLARDVAHNVGLGVPELGLCKGLTELLRAFNREFGAVEVLTDRAVGPKRPATNYASGYLAKTCRKTFFTKVPIRNKQNPTKLHQHVFLQSLALPSLCISSVASVSLFQRIVT